MKLSVVNLKKKMATKFDALVKAATSRAIPVVKAEAKRQILSTADGIGAIPNILLAAGLVTGVFLLTKKPSGSAARGIATTIINIETLNLYMGGN